MAEFVADCPRCGATSITFDALGDNPRSRSDYYWEFEILSRCRACSRCSVGLAITKQAYTAGVYSPGGLSGANGFLDWVNFVRFTSPADQASRPIPESLPINVANCFREGAAAFAIGAYNASAAMFRLSLDIATKELLPDGQADSGGPNNAQRKRLYDRLAFLFDRRLIAPELRDLADCVREDGNDGAHDGNLTKADAEDLIDFAEQLLERVYTEPARLRIAKARREARRAGEAAA